jgi:hypothetical protein
VKVSTKAARASHVNSGTSVPPEELPWPEVAGAVMRMPKLHAEVEGRSEVTPYGGLLLFSDMVKRLGIAKLFDEHVHVFKIHLPYHESDHVLAQAMNLYVGGTCLEDMTELQHSEAVLRLVGACRLPDPTTGGDFLRRLRESDPSGLPGLRRANDEALGPTHSRVLSTPQPPCQAQSQAWRKLAQKGGKRKRKLAIVDLDGHVKTLYGVQKEGADFYKGTWCYQPVVATLAQSGECLGIRNQPGAVRASSGAPELLDTTLPRTKRHFVEVLVRGDSDFDRADVRNACERHGAHFAFVGREFRNRPGIAESIQESRWQPFRAEGGHGSATSPRSGWSNSGSPRCRGLRRGPP